MEVNGVYMSTVTEAFNEDLAQVQKVQNNKIKRPTANNDQTLTTAVCHQQ